MNIFTRPYSYILFLLFVLASPAHAQTPVASFTANPTTGCSPMIVSFTNTSADTVAGAAYTWDLGNGNTSHFRNTTGTYNANAGSGSTTFTVTLTVTNPNGQTSSASQTITAYNPPTVNFSASDTAGCSPFTTSFTSSINWNSPGTGTYHWDFGNGNASAASAPTYTFQPANYYTITLLAVSAAGCSTSVSKPLYIHARPQPQSGYSFAPNGICNVPGTTIFTSNNIGSGPFTTSWDFGDGGTGTGSPVSHTYTSYGNYTINFIVTDVYGCKDTVNVPNGVIAAPLHAQFTAHPDACVGESVDFNNTTVPNATSYQWNFGDGTPATMQINPSHIFSTAGNYTVRLVAFNNGCSDTFTQGIIIHPKPVINFSYAPLVPCPPPSDVQFNNATTGASTYNWYFGDGGTSTDPNPVHTYNNWGGFNITLIATSSFGCSDTVKRPNYVIVDPFSTYMTGTFAGCLPLTVNFSTTPSTYPSPITSYDWSFGDGTPNSSLAAPVHTYTAVGIYTATVTLHAANGCSKIITQQIKVGTPPTANFGASPTNVCVDDLVSFTDSSQNVTDWFWSFGDGSNSSAEFASHNYAFPGIYDVELKVFNNGCPDSMLKTAYIKVNYPKSIPAFTYSCSDPLTVTFHNNSLGYSGYTWYFGDGTSSGTLNPLHTYPGTGTYVASLVCWNDTTGCHDTTKMTIDIIKLVPSFVASSTAICKDATVSFTSSVTGGTSVQYTWAVDNLTFADTTANFQYTFHTTGYHSVSFTVKDANGCLIDTIKTNYIIVGWPTPLFTANPIVVCAPSSVLFTDVTSVVPGTTIATRIWDLGFGPQPNNPNLTTTQLYTAAGSYTVKLVLTDNIGCKDSIVSMDYIKVRKPVADFSAFATTSCPGLPVVFYNNSQGSPLDYTWDFGDGNTSTSVSPSHVYTQTGTYTVKLVVFDNLGGCKDSVVKTAYITITTKPTAAFTVSDTFKICSPLPVTFTNNSVNATSYTWDFGDNGSSTLINPSHIYQAGIFDIILSAANQYGCRDTARARVRVLGYAGALTYTPLTGCAPLTVQFTALEHNVPGFVFDFADGSTLVTTSLTATHTYLQAGPYVPSIIMTDNAGCSSTSFGLDTIKADGVYGGFTYDPYPACDKGTLHFLDTSRGAYSTINSRYWIFHDGLTSTSDTPSHYYPGLGTYPITLIHTTTTGCIDTVTTSVTFYPFPVIDAGPDTTICLGDAATLDPSGGVSYVWSPAATLSCDSCTHPDANPTIPTLYTVIGKDVHGCSNTDTVRVSIKTKTVSTVSSVDAICEGDTIRLNVSGAQHYVWLPPYGLDNSTVPDPLAQPDTTVRYTVIASEGSCIADTNYVTVTVHPRPHVNAGPDQTIIAGNTTQLNATGNSITQYAWSPSETLSCNNCSDPEATPVGTTVYTVKAYTDYGCHDSDDVRINVICQQSQLYIPNTFTPNQDGQNDRFYPRGKGIRTIKSFRIYDRWGEVIFSKTNMDVNDYNNGWDGTNKGQQLSPDVFVYTIDGICDTGEEFSWQGDISLIR